MSYDTTSRAPGVAQAVKPREHAEQAVETEGPLLIRKQAIVVVHGQGNDYWRDLSGTWSPASPHLTTLRDAVGIMRF